MCSTRRGDRRDYKNSNTCETFVIFSKNIFGCTTKTLKPKGNLLTQETNQMSLNLLVWLFSVATPMENEPKPIESGAYNLRTAFGRIGSGALNLRSAFVESAEQARCSSTSGGLPRPELGYCQPTPPYKTAAQFSRSLSRSSFSCARLRLVHATAHANANDLSTPAVE